MRGRRLPRPGGWFGLALVLALVAAITTARAAADGGRTTGVLVAAADLPVGEHIDRDPGLVRVARVPQRGLLPGMVRAIAEVEGRVLAVPLAAGEPVTQAALGGDARVAPRRLAPGERAISVPLAAAGAAAAILAPTVTVDVVGAIGRGDAASAGVVVRAAEVVAVTQPPGAADPAGDGGAVLLRMGERDALRLSAVLDAGGVRLLPRPVDEAVAP